MCFEKIVVLTLLGCPKGKLQQGVQIKDYYTTGYSSHGLILH